MTFGTPSNTSRSTRFRKQASTGRAITTEGRISSVTAFFHLLSRELFLALFLCLGFGHLLGRVKIHGFTLGSTASSLLVALVVSGVAFNTAGVRFAIPDLTQTTALSLFLYAVGLRVGPQFLAGLRREGVHLVILTLVTAALNFLLVFYGSRWADLPPGFAPGMISGGYNVTAAMGVASNAVTTGTYQLPAGITADQVVANIAAGYSLTYVFSLLGIVLLITHLPSMFGIDPIMAGAEATKKFSASKDPAPGTAAAFEHGMLHGDIRVFRLTNAELAGKPVYAVFQKFDTPVVRLTRDGKQVLLEDNPSLELGDLLTVAGQIKNLIGETATIGPEVADENVRLTDLDQAEIVVTKPQFEGKTLQEFHESLDSYAVRVRAIFRQGQEMPLLPGTVLQKHDVLRVIGPGVAVNRAVEALGQAVRPTEATNVVTLSLGAAVGYMVGLLSVNISGIPIGLGTPAGVIIAGIVVATVRTMNPRLGGPVPEGARSFLENVGLDLFVTSLGLKVAPSLLNALSQGRVVAMVVLVGMIGALVPPIVSWLIGLYVFKMDPILLAGAVAGSRSSTTAMKAMQDTSKSSVPAFGYPVPYALSAVIVLIFAYLAMVFY
jgi:putative transport protein